MIVEIDQTSLIRVRRLVDEILARRVGTRQESMAYLIEGPKKFDLLVRAFSAELAVSQYLGKEWNYEYAGPAGFDIDPNIEVRNTRPGRPLYIKRREIIQGQYEKPPSARYVLTWTGDDLKKIAIVGWTTLAETLEESKIHKVNGQMFGLMFPPERLRPIESLRNDLQTT